MIGNFKDVREPQLDKFASSPLGKEVAGLGAALEKFVAKADKALIHVLEQQNMYFCPSEHGEWSGDRGNSRWIPDKNYVPLKSNPEGKTWGQILKDFHIDSINFRDGEPDFGPISKGNVEIKGFTENRTDNFDKADIELAKQRGCSPEEVRKWRKENGYTWHECKDMKTMQKVPSIIHNNIPHSGGISESKKGV